MLTERRAARKVALNERINLIRLQGDLDERYCAACDKKNNRQDPTILCGGCPVYKELLEIGKKLTEVNKTKREFAEVIEDEPEVIEYCGRFLDNTKTLRVIKGHHDKEGNSFKVGTLYQQKSNTKGSRIVIVGQDNKEYSLTQHRYYNYFIDVNKFKEEYVPLVYVCTSEFKTHEIGFKSHVGQEFKLIKEKSTLSSKVFEVDGIEVRVSKDTFYKKLEKKRND